jgi:hypothetical protein
MPPATRPGLPDETADPLRRTALDLAIQVAVAGEEGPKTVARAQEFHAFLKGADKVYEKKVDRGVNGVS